MPKDCERLQLLRELVGGASRHLRERAARLLLALYARIAALPLTVLEGPRSTSARPTPAHAGGEPALNMSADDFRKWSPLARGWAGRLPSVVRLK
jgi:hypothetical protein